MKYFYFIFLLLILFGCGGNNSKIYTSNDDVNFSSNGVIGKLVFNKDNKYTSNIETININSATANQCNAQLLNPQTFQLNKNNPTYDYTFNIIFNNSPCYTNQISINYEKILYDSKEEKSVSVLNPQYNQKNVYKQNGTDPLYKYQWYLKNTGQNFAIIPAIPGEDIDIEKVWDENITGKGIVVGIIANGVDMFHPDLKNNIDWTDSYNYLNGSHNTTPEGKNLNYNLIAYDGTTIAGLIAAEGWNGIGIRGVAPNAKIASLNALISSKDNLKEIRLLDALVRNLKDIDIYNICWEGNESSFLNDINYTSKFDTQITYGIKFGRNTNGDIYVKGSGNEGNLSNANFEQTQTSGYIINVGAVGANGKITSYSTPGSAILISAPGGYLNLNGLKESKLSMVTTDLSGDERGYDEKNITLSSNHFNVKGNENYDYTDHMYGTDASAALVSGVIALMLQANPNLSYRDIKIILAETARKNDANDTGWHTNAAGLHFNYKYGFGVIDAAKAVEKAKTFKSIGNFDNIITAYNTVMPNKVSSNGELNISIPIDKNITIEDVKLYLTIENNSSYTYKYSDYTKYGTNNDLSSYYLYKGYNNLSIGSSNLITFTIYNETTKQKIFSVEVNGTDNSTINISKSDNYVVQITNNNNNNVNWQYKILSPHPTTTINNINISLISPMGTKSILVKAPNSLTMQDKYSNTRLLSTNFIGEKSKGNWILKIKSLNGGEFKLLKATLEITGH